MFNHSLGTSVKETALALFNNLNRSWTYKGQETFYRHVMVTYFGALTRFIS